MPIREDDHVARLQAERGRAGERERALVETSGEDFDRVAFAYRALALVCPPRTRVAICEGIFRVRVDSGKSWRGLVGPSREGDRWAILSIPPRASRRAIALAVAELAAGTPAPYAFDLLMADCTAA